MNSIIKNELVNKPSIHNQADQAEIAIKNHIAVGKTYRSWSELFKLVGLENLGVKNLAGGKQKKRAKENLLQYAYFAEVSTGKHLLKCIEIYDIPHYKIRTDNRGKSGKYIDKLIPIALWYFNESEQEFHTSTNKLAYSWGLTRTDVQKLNYTALHQKNAKFTYSMISHCLSRCVKKYQSIIFNTLDRLQNDYKVIRYVKDYYISTTEGSHYSTLNEIELIKAAEDDILKEFEIENIQLIRIKKLTTEFYGRVCQLISATSDYEWVFYCPQIHIFIDQMALQNTLKKFFSTKKNVNELKKQVAIDFAKSVYQQTIGEYDKTNQKACHIKDELWNNTPTNIKELVDMGLYLKSEILSMYDKPFEYHDNYLDIQYKLITELIASPNTSDGQQEDKSLDWLDDIV